MKADSLIVDIEVISGSVGKLHQDILAYLKKNPTKQLLQIIPRESPHVEEYFWVIFQEQDKYLKPASN